jgi:GNAT superfamily N-acetyltransferase
MSSATLIRRAAPQERSGVVAVVAAAFADDPAWLFLFEDAYERLAPEFAGTLFDLRVGKGNVWVTDDLASVAMWDEPSPETDLSPSARGLWDRFIAVAGDAAHERLIAYKRALAAVAPDCLYWYLGVLATDPARVRRGLATAVLAPVLAEADRDRLPCCLETSTLANRRFYERRGFSEPVDVVVPAGPPTWWLCRQPRARAQAGGSRSRSPG